MHGNMTLVLLPYSTAHPHKSAQGADAWHVRAHLKPHQTSTCTALHVAHCNYKSRVALTPLRQQLLA